MSVLERIQQPNDIKSISPKEYSILADEIAPDGSSSVKITLFKILYFLIRYVAPLAIIVIFITNLLM